ncbi:MAG: transporter substrate-binding domain-containing protein [Actinobacteria bacterium]|nr:transporter substrate-binding domain-containing protein [Actinomycetota bacterium]
MRSALLVAGLVLGVACVPEPDKLTDDSIEVFDADSVLGEIQATGRLVVAIDPGAPPISSIDPSSGEPEGLGIELAELVARALGVETSYRRAPSDDLAGIVAAGAADIAFPPTSLTTPRLKSNPYTNPYYVGHQRLLVPRGSPVDSVDDLAGKQVCSFIDPETEISLDGLDPEIDVDPASTLGYCVEALERGDVDAVTSSDLNLMRLAATGPGWRIAGEQLTTEGYGAMVPPGAASFADFVDAVMREARLDGLSAPWYEEWIAPLGEEDSVAEPPELTAEEVAAFFPEESIAPE